MTGKNVDFCIRLGAISYSPDIRKLVKDSESKIFH